MNNIEFIIDEDGNILVNRDNDRILSILKEILEPQEFDQLNAFFQDKPLNISGNKNYQSFCG
jgi:hypothetical protein